MQTLTNSDSQAQQSGIRITPSALERLKELRDKQDKDVYLRVSVRQGGCAGMSYVMAFDDSSHTILGDELFDFDGLKVICDPKSLSCLDGLIVDYGHSIIGVGGEFQFVNPQAEDTCCCGQSFATAIA